jgi:carbamoyltransferase
MNVMGEPIVNTPEQAYSMIVKTDMDCIVMGNNLVRK